MIIVVFNDIFQSYGAKFSSVEVKVAEKPLQLLSFIWIRLSIRNRYTDLNDTEYEALNITTC